MIGGIDATNTERIRIDTSVPLSDIEERMGELRRMGRSAVVQKSLSRLGFIHLRYRGFTVRDAAGIIGVSVQTGYNWQDVWNACGMESVSIDRHVGRAPRLSSDDKAELAEYVASNNPSTAEASAFISKRFGIDYSMKQVHIILSSSGLVHIPREAISGFEGGGNRNSARMVWSRPI